MAKLSKARHKQLVAYVAEVQHAMRLEHWNIFVSRSTEKRDEAAVRISEDHHEVELRASAGLFTKPRWYQRQVITHELCHLIMTPYEHVVADTCQPRKVASRSLDRVCEHVVDDFAWLLAPSMPMPPWWKP